MEDTMAMADNGGRTFAIWQKPDTASISVPTGWAKMPRLRGTDPLTRSHSRLRLFLRTRSILPLAFNRIHEFEFIDGFG